MKALIAKILLVCVLAASFSVSAFGASGVMNYVTERGLVAGEAVEDEDNSEDEEPANETGAAVPILTNHYNSVSGTISEIIYDGKNTVLLLSGTQNDIYYNITPDVLVYSLNAMEPISAGRLSKGRRVSVFYNVYNEAAGFPATLTPEVLVLHDNEQASLVKVDYFDDTALSSDRKLKLNRNEEMLIVSGNSRIANFDELKNKNLLVFYDVSTLSPSAQAPPMKVVILGSEVLRQKTAAEDLAEPEDMPDESPLPEEIYESERDILVRNLEGYAITRGEIRYVPLYKLAETMGFDLAWNDAIKQVTIYTNNEASYTITNGLLEYSQGGEKLYFTNAPFISDSRVYVEEKFLENLFFE